MSLSSAYTPATKFGKDHWSVLAYAVSCCEDAESDIGTLNSAKMRCNPTRRPLLCRNTWQESYSTRLHGFFEFEDRADVDQAVSAGLQLLGHDDWDCLDDIEAAGMVEVLSLANPTVRMTAYGLDVCARLREYKVSGGHYFGFTLPQPTPAAA